MAETTSCRIRAVAAEDVPTVVALIRGLAEYERMADEMVATEAQIRDALFPPDGTPPLVHSVLAEADGEAAGFALYFFNFSTFLGRNGLYLEDLFVRPAWRSRGIGKALWLHLARLATARGCGRMEWSVLDWNEHAIAFYESLGAVRLRQWQICRLEGASLDRYR